MIRLVTPLALLLLHVSSAGAQQPDRAPNLKVGDAVVTGFSGTIAPNAPAANRSIVDLTFINPDGPSARIVDVARPGHVWDGRLLAAPKTFDVTAKDVGQVFGIALDDQTRPNIYLASTSAFGLHIVGRGRDDLPERRKKGAPGAGWMRGLFGLDLQGGPGSIYKVDGGTGAVSLLANVTLDGVPNPGPGLGNLAYDAVNKQLFVSDLYTGMIHRIGLDGADRGRYDHGVTGRPARMLAPVAFAARNRPNIASDRFDSENPATWGFAPPSRQVWGLAVREGRLYYSVTEGPQIWSVAIQQDGSFGDARWELDIPREAGPFPVSDIVFSEKGAMILAQRASAAGSYDYSAFTRPGEPRVLRFWLESPDDPQTPSRWNAAAEEYAVGFAGNYRNSNGGVDLGYGYGEDGMLGGGACEQSLWTTGENLRNNPALRDRLAPGGELLVHGLQGSPSSPVRNFNEPPWTGYFVDYDDTFTDPRAKGHLGGVRIFRQPCPVAVAGGPGFGGNPPYLSGPTTSTPPPPPDCVGPNCDPCRFGTNPDGSCRQPIDLAIKKTAGEAKFDPKTGAWTITFTLTVTNAGMPFSPGGSISINDPVPTGLTFTGATGTGWTCTGSLDCGYNFGSGVFNTGASLPPITITATTKIPGDYENCATVAAMGQTEVTLKNNRDCATVNVPRRIQIEKINISRACTPESLCLFQIKVINLDPVPFVGPVTIADNTTLAMNIAFTDVPCTPAPTSLPFSCTTGVLNIPASGSLTFSVNGVIPAGSVPITGVSPDPINCATLSNAPIGTTIVIPKDCKPYKVPCGFACHMDDPQIAQIRIDKKANQAQCSPGGMCSFTYTISNVSTTTPTMIMPITFLDTMPPGSATYVSATPAPWGCTPFGGPGTIKCLFPPGSIPAGGQISVTVTYQIAPGYNQPTLTNCSEFFIGQAALANLKKNAAEVMDAQTLRTYLKDLNGYLKERGVAALSMKPIVLQPDDKSCATVDIVSKPQLGMLVVNKTVTSAAAVPVTGLVFPVTVTCGTFTTTGTVSEKMPLTVRNIPAPSTCSITEGALPALPANVCGPGGKPAWSAPSYKPASVTIERGGTASATVHNEVLCEKPIVVGTPVCEPGTTIRKGLQCVCRYQGMVRTSATACACAEGSKLVAGRGCVRPPQCAAPMVLNSAGTACVCPAGTRQRGRACVPPIECRAPQIANKAGTACVCPAGTVQRGRECVRQIECRPPAKRNAAGTACVCPANMIAQGNSCIPRLGGPGGLGEGGKGRGDGGLQKGDGGRPKGGEGSPKGGEGSPKGGGAGQPGGFGR